MARFPESEPDIAALAMVLIEGLRKTPELFPAPPVPADALQAGLDEYNQARTAAVAPEAAARELVTEQEQGVEWEFRVYGENKGGVGERSTVLAVVG